MTCPYLLMKPVWLTQTYILGPETMDKRQSPEKPFPTACFPWHTLEEDLRA